jgi:hypothetical protein
MDNKKSLQDYTESEFRAFLNLIFETNANEPDEILDPLLEHFTAIIEHPSGTDLIYWPEAKGLDEPDEIIRIIKAWRLANNKPLFKSH